jgi:hypothetical protein
MDVSIKTSFACGVYTSCSKNAFFRQMDATKNMMGFLNFFGTSGVYQNNPDDPTDTSTHVASYYQLSEDPKKNPYETNVVTCQTNYDKDATHDEFGYIIDPTMPCNCTSCQATCKPIDWTKIIRTNRVVDGFQVKTLYLAAFLILMVIFSRLWSCYRKRQKKDKRASLDSYDRIKNIIESNERENN